MTKRIRVQIINKTPYRTADLRAWTIAALKHRGAYDRHPVWKVTWKRSNTHITGRAWVNTGIFSMSIPSPHVNAELWKKFVGGNSYRRTLAYVILHEIDHCLGLRGEREMRGAFRADPDGFLKGFPDLPWPSVAPKPAAKPRGKARPIEIKLDEARRRAEMYARRERAAVRWKRKWLAKVRYYEKRQAASGGTS